MNTSFNAIAQQNEFSKNTQSLSTKRIANLEAKALFGSVLPHYSYMNYLSETYRKGIAIHYTIQPAQKTIYDKIWKQPNYGIGVRHITMGNAERLGNLTTLHMVFNGNFSNNITRFAPYYQINAGLAYAHKNMKKSLYNTAVSSPLSFFAAINCGVEFQIINASYVRLGIELEHISNGKTTTPNLGFNSILLAASYKHRFENQCKKAISEDFSKPTMRHHRINFAAAGFFKTDDFVTEKKYFTSLLSAEYEWLSKTYWWGAQAGVDCFYDRSIGALKPAIDHKKFLDGGIHAGVFVKYSHVVILVQLGKYIASTTQNADFFTRIGLRYEWQRLFANASLRAHGITAQNIEMGIGYKLHFGKKQ